MTKPPTKAQREHWSRVAAAGCMVCGMPPEIHHCFTGGGGRKNHDLVIGLCHLHHRGKLGIHFMGRKKWQPLFGYEKDLLDRLNRIIDNDPIA
jgi:hypothetical protein